MEKRTNETITLGSGKVYIKEYTGTIPENSALEVMTNLLAWIKGGAALEYSMDFYEASDDLGMVSKRKMTVEKADLKTGIMTWNGETLKYLSTTAKVAEDAGIRTTKLGGADSGKQYIVHFVHEDPVDGDVRVTIVGQNTSGFTLTFKPDEETVIDAVFSATKGKLDDVGTLVIIQEEIGASVP
ncbi:MAG: hypothetical protein FWG40_01115 [Peptococcaceae bacterium]|nr:hypothetical protein [Peptococcaceae bacterium]